MEDGAIIESGECNTLINSIDGMIFETVVEDEEMKILEQKYCIVNFHNEGDGKVRIRYISKLPLKNSKLMKPDLNDYYLSKVRGAK
jgi:hypothetical protein